MTTAPLKAMPSAKPNLLVVEDDLTTRMLLRKFLEVRGYAVHEAATARAALEHANGCDAVLLDVGLPDLTGWQVAEVLRADAPDVPIVFVTGHGTLEHRLAGFELGAEDYVTKPYDLHELEARLRVVLRRRTPPVHALRFGDTIVDLAARCVFRQGHRVQLTPLEFDVLALMATNGLRVWSRRELLERLWSETLDTTERTVDVRIRHIRAVLDDDARAPRFIETVRGRGYRWVAEPTANDDMG